MGISIGNVARNESGALGAIEKIICSSEGNIFVGINLENEKEWTSYSPIVLSETIEKYSENISNELKDLLNPSRFKEISDYIMDNIDSNHSSDNLEFSFDISHGEMKGEDINTTYRFDPDKDNILYKISNYIYSKDIVLLEEHNDMIFDFMEGLRTYISDNCIDIVKQKIRKYVIGDSPEIIFPLKKIEIINIEINDSEEEAPISVQKNVPYIKTMVNGKPKLKIKEEDYSPVSVAAELMRIHKETGVDYNTIIANKKAMGDANYRYVEKVIIGKRTKYIIHIDMYVDYSMNKKEAIEKFLEEEKQK